MNWGRGLFRLWLIFGVLWAAVWIAIFVLDHRLLEANRAFEIEGRFKEKYEVVAPATVTETEVVAFAQRNQRADCSESKTGPWCSYPVKLQMQRKAINPIAIYLALGVPAGMLLIGGALYWALSGFRRTT
ncbi:hypothetical protein ACVMFA_007396 [Bradyrhizobium liaoningense]